MSGECTHLSAVRESPGAEHSVLTAADDPLPASRYLERRCSSHVCVDPPLGAAGLGVPHDDGAIVAGGDDVRVVGSETGDACGACVRGSSPEYGLMCVQVPQRPARIIIVPALKV